VLVSSVSPAAHDLEVALPLLLHRAPRDDRLLSVGPRDAQVVEREAPVLHRSSSDAPLEVLAEEIDLAERDLGLAVEVERLALQPEATARERGLEVRDLEPHADDVAEPAVVDQDLEIDRGLVREVDRERARVDRLSFPRLEESSESTFVSDESVAVIASANRVCSTRSSSRPPSP
jgi:hypothetical protein